MFKRNCNFDLTVLLVGFDVRAWKLRMKCKLTNHRTRMVVSSSFTSALNDADHVPAKVDDGCPRQHWSFNVEHITYDVTAWHRAVNAVLL